MISLEEKAYTAFYWKALSVDTYEPRGLSCGSTLNICQEIMNCANSLHKRGFLNSQMMTNLPLKKAHNYFSVISKSLSTFIFLILKVMEINIKSLNQRTTIILSKILPVVTNLAAVGNGVMRKQSLKI